MGEEISYGAETDLTGHGQNIGKQIVAHGFDQARKAFELTVLLVEQIVLLIIGHDRTRRKPECEIGIRPGAEDV